MTNPKRADRPYQAIDCTDPETRLLWQAFMLSAVVRTTTLEPAKKFGLSESAILLLCLSGSLEEIITFGDLAQMLGFDRSNITLLVNQLVHAGFVDRKAHPTDGRARVLTLTSKGITARSNIVSYISQRSALSVLKLSERLQLSELLAKIISGMSEKLPDDGDKAPFSGS